MITAVLSAGLETVRAYNAVLSVDLDAVFDGLAVLSVDIDAIFYARCGVLAILTSGVMTRLSGMTSSVI